jgi:hypothetical protein
LVGLIELLAGARRLALRGQPVGRRTPLPLGEG